MPNFHFLICEESYMCLNIMTGNMYSEKQKGGSRCTMHKALGRNASVRQSARVFNTKAILASKVSLLKQAIVASYFSESGGYISSYCPKDLNTWKNRELYLGKWGKLRLPKPEQNNWDAKLWGVGQFFSAQQNSPLFASNRSEFQMSKIPLQLLPTS